MKKIICFALSAALCCGAAAQTWQDALLFSQNNYSGTARGVGMGNALTAIGGDPGSLVFNPAGSAVASYSQFTITPGLTLSLSNAQGTANGEYGMGDLVNTSYGKVKLPNVGFVMNMDSGKRSGLKRMSFGFVFHSTNNFTGRYNGSGVNEDNSYAASLASSADGYSSEVLAKEDWYYSGDAARMPAWVDMTGYRGGLFNGVTGRDGAYVAITEMMDANGNFRLAAPVFQRYGQQTYGSKNDMVLNYALNFSDKLYVGANLGITTLRYHLAEYWQETPDNPDDFPAIEYSDGTSARFESLRMKHNYQLLGTGVYFKLGVLARPVAGLRIGAAIQTPTLFNLTERYSYYADVNLSGKYTAPASSPEDEWTYGMVSPFIFNAGLAYSFGNVAVVSADYELCNYGQARFRERTDHYGYDSESGMFAGVNKDIKNLLGPSQQLRLGTEFKLSPVFSLRAGYNLVTSGELDSQQRTHSVSGGLGVSLGEFYIDAAVRARFIPDQYVIPYNYYVSNGVFYNKVVDESVLTPEILVKTTCLDALLTLGWRF